MFPDAAGVRCEGGWRCLRVAGSGFAASTFDTDYLLVREDDLDLAAAALREAGHVVQPGEG
jgi:hypothetical protein